MSPCSGIMLMQNMRIGHGYDVHAFGSGSYIVLAGVRIAHEKGLIAHSDGDVLLHALSDALLGAAALGDIGQHFPATDAAFKNISSRVLLGRVAALLQSANWRPVNVDTTVIAQVPKLAPYINEMRANIAQDLAVSPASVSVKATTTEGLGFAGRREGIAAHAVCLLQAIS